MDHGGERGRLRAPLTAGAALVAALLVVTLVSAPDAPAAERVATDHAQALRPVDPDRAAALRALVADQDQLRVSDTSAEALRLDAVAPQPDGAQVARFQQVADGVPVYAGQVVVQVGSGGELLSVTGETTAPGRARALVRRGFVVDAHEAEQIALAAAASRLGRIAARLDAGTPVRQVYDPALFDEPGPARAAWLVVVTGPAGSGEVVEVLVGAGRGRVLQLVERRPSLTRSICDNRNDSGSRIASGYWCRSDDPNGSYLPPEVQPAAAAALMAYVDLGNVSDLFEHVLDTDLTAMVGLEPYALGDDGRELTATVRFCEPGERCPYANAFWADADPRFVPGPGRRYPGGQVFIGDGLEESADVIAHEVTHGVTAAVSGLKYVRESGAINESLSDVFGQLSQLYDARRGAFVPGRDRRWLIGEDLDLPGLRGAVRSMSNPSSTRLPAGDPQPSRMTHRAWESGRQDGGGVHTNSGVGNKTAYLIARGGRFNGYQVRGLGEQATARIYWRAAHLLTPASNYRALATALARACHALYGSGSRACASVRTATAATEISQSTVRIGVSKKRPKARQKVTVKVRLRSIRGASVRVGSAQRARVTLSRRYVGNPRWHRLGTKKLSSRGIARWNHRPVRKVVYRAKYHGSRGYGLATATGKSRVVTVRR